MNHRSTIAAVLLSTIAIARAGIDLTPSVSDYVAEGIKHQQLTFVQDKRQIRYEPPAGWGYNGGSKQLRLTPKKTFADATITAVPLPKPAVLDDNSIKVLQEQFLASLPVGSQFAKVEEQNQNPVLLGGNATFEIVVSYQSMGEKFLCSAVFANVGDTQLVFRLTARKDDFQALHREFKSSLFSWQWTEPTETAETSAEASSVTAR